MKPAMKHNLLLVSTISICFTFAGCKTVGPDYVVPASRLPEAFSATTAGNDAGSEQIKEWWRHFGDAELSALIADALTQNPDVAMADTRLRQLRAFQSIQDSATAPTVNATGRVSKDTLSQNGEQFANVPLSIHWSSSRTVKLALTHHGK